MGSAISCSSCLANTFGWQYPIGEPRRLLLAGVRAPPFLDQTAGDGQRRGTDRCAENWAQLTLPWVADPPIRVHTPCRPYVSGCSTARFARSSRRAPQEGTQNGPRAVPGRGGGELGADRHRGRHSPQARGASALKAGRRGRCGRCGTVAPWFDRGDGERRWRHVDVGYATCELVADAPRVACPDHGPTVAEVPWARHDTAFSRAFEDLVVHDAIVGSKQAAADRYAIS